MRIVVDTNILFSAMLNTNSRIARAKGGDIEFKTRQP